MKTPQVFVSYSHADRKSAEKIATYLRENGVNVWLDKWEILAGDSLIEKIFEEGLSECDVFLILLSNESAKSNWVQRELDVAMINKIKGITKIIPVLVEKCNIPNALRPLKWVDLSSGFEEGARELLKGIFDVREKPELGRAPEFIVSRTESVGGLSPEATNLGKFLIGDSEESHPFEKRYDVRKLADALGFTPQEMNDAIEELEYEGLLRSMQLLGTRPYNYAEVEPTYPLYLHFRGVGTSYDPEEDIRVVACAVAAKEQLTGHDIQEITKLSPSRINRAASYLEDYGIIQVLKHLGSAPFAFGRAMATGLTRKFVREQCQ